MISATVWKAYFIYRHRHTIEQPDLTVNAVSLDGSKAFRMWTIIDPQSSDASADTTYKVYFESDHKDRVFDRLEGERVQPEISGLQETRG